LIRREEVLLMVAYWKMVCVDVDGLSMKERCDEEAKTEPLEIDADMKL
jgi:hypothetical protein